LLSGTIIFGFVRAYGSHLVKEEIRHLFLQRLFNIIHIGDSVLRI
jgi:hypothetical protein